MENSKDLMPPLPIPATAVTCTATTENKRVFMDAIFFERDIALIVRTLNASHDQPSGHELASRINAELARISKLDGAFVCCYCGAKPEDMKEPRRYDYCIRKKCANIVCSACAASAPRGHREVRKYHHDSGQLMEYTKYGPVCKCHAASTERRAPASQGLPDGEPPQGPA